MSRIDFCNSILYGLTDAHTKKLQRIQNSAARLVTQTQKRDQISPILHDLHWLLTKYRIQYKILSLEFLCLQGLGPTYLQELIQKYHPVRSLRSKSKSLLVCPPTFIKCNGARAFAASATELWNSLLDNIKQAQTVNLFNVSLEIVITRCYRKPFHIVFPPSMQSYTS